MRNSDLRILQLLLVEPDLSTTELRLRGGYNRSEVLESKGWIKFKKNPPAKEWALTGQGRQALMDEVGPEGIKDLRENGVPEKEYSDDLGSNQMDIIRYIATFPGPSSTEINHQCGGQSVYQRLEVKGFIYADSTQRSKEWFLTPKGETVWDGKLPLNDRGRWSGPEAIWNRFKGWKLITPKNISKEFVLTYSDGRTLLEQWADAGRVEAVGDNLFKVV